MKASLLIAVLLLAAVAGPASAQQQPPPQEPPAPADSTALFFIRPSYTTGFNVIKTRQTWTQRLTIDQMMGEVDVNGSLSSDINTDSAQNDLEHYVSRANGAFDYKVLGARFGATFNVDRTKRLSTTSELRETVEEVSATGAFERAVMGLKMTSNALGGYRERQNKGDRTVGQQQQQDDTVQSGPSLGFGWGLTNRTGTAPPVAFAINLTGDWFWHETRDEQFDFIAAQDSIVQDQTTVLSGTNRTLGLTADASWAPTGALDLSAKLNRSLSNQLRPAPLQGELEEAENDDVAGGFTARFQATEELSFNASLDLSEQKQANINPVLNRDTQSMRFSITGDYTWQGFDLSSTFEQRSEDQLYKPVQGESETNQTDLESEFVRLRGKVARDFSKVRISMTSDLSLDQKFYQEDRDGEVGVLDSDRQNRTTDFTLSYDPSSKLNSRVSITENRRRTVNVNDDPGRAGNTNTEQRLSVSANYTYKTPWRVSITQSLSVSAQSRVFDFADADKSDLTRTSILRTTFGIQLLPLTTVKLEHNYNFRNSGQYSRDDDGVRRFRLDREFIEQEMVAEAVYAPVDWFDVRAEQSLRVVENRTPGLEGVRTPQYDFEVEAKLNRRLLDAVDTRLRATRILSTREDNYWRVDMSASRTFF